jgi:YD repeat-containing protein
MRNICIVFYIISIFICLTSKAQNLYERDLPKLTPRSPEAAALGRYGEYPVSLHTGIPDISIPLFEIKTGKFSVPITLSYHASGNKVNDFAGWVGLGWSLDAGGRISRVVKGKVDQSFTRNVRSKESINPQDAADFQYLRFIAEGTTSYDTEPDIYNYSFPGKSGQFIFDNSSNPIMIPYCGVKVSSINSPNNLIDENGNEFIFGIADQVTADYPSKWDYSVIPPSWLLTKIFDTGKTESVIFNYQSLGNGTLGLDYVDYVNVEDNVIDLPNSGPYTSQVGPLSNYVIHTQGSELVLSEINFSEGKVKFIPTTSDRLDRTNYGGTGTGFKYMDRIEIYSTDDLLTPIKKIVFYQSYFDNGTDKRLRLDSLRIFDKNSQVVQRYNFNYNNSINLPAINSYAKDFWGYYNGKVNNTSFLPQMTVDFMEDDYGPTTQRTIGNNDPTGREPNPNTMQAYILNKITYPTRGYTTFEYETNKYINIGNSKYAGGLRILQIKNYNDNNELCSTKTYKYGEGESGYGRFNAFMSDFYYSTPALTFQYRLNEYSAIATKRSRTFTSNPCTDINSSDGSPVVYSIVTEYFGDGTTNIGKNIYQYTDDPDVLGSYVQIDKSFKFNRGFRRGLLDSKTTYKNENGIFKKVYYVKNNYFAYPTQNNYLSLNVVQRKVYDGFRANLEYDDYECVNTPIFYGDNLLTSTSEYFYDMNDETKYTVKSTNYSYNSLNYTQVASVKTIDSKQTELTKTYKYPTDYPSSACEVDRQACLAAAVTKRDQNLATCNQIQDPSARATCVSYHTSIYNNDIALCENNFNNCASTDEQIITEMQNKNMINTTIEEQTLQVKNNVTTLTGGTINKFKKENGLILPFEKYELELNVPSSNLTISSINSSGQLIFNPSYTKKLIYDKYDTKGNILQTTGRDGIVTSYLWDATGNYPMAQVTGATYSQISAQNGQTANFNSLTLRDSLNTLVPSAFIQTFSYKPLVGMTSQTDPNGKTTYYDYDDFGRLKLIKDDQNKILKKFDYHYSNQ